MAKTLPTLEDLARDNVRSIVTACVLDDPPAVMIAAAGLYDTWHALTDRTDAWVYTEFAAGEFATVAKAAVQGWAAATGRDPGDVWREILGGL